MKIIRIAAPVAVVVVTVAFGSVTLVVQLIREGGSAAVPWNLLSTRFPAY
ncbi:MAG: hypothetical protein P8X59_04425 [Woeseiaceae bacterium]